MTLISETTNQSTMSNLARDRTHAVQVGNILIGGGNPIVVQSMTDTDTADIDATVKQVKLLADAGSEIVRITVNNDHAAAATPEIASRLNDLNCTVPLVGDFHFIGHRLLREHVQCAKTLAKFRINPGNIGKGKRHDENFNTFIKIARDLGKPVRIGVNAGSLDQELLADKMDANSRLPQPLDADAVERQALVESAIASAETAVNIGLPQNMMVISCKVSRLSQMVEAYRAISNLTDIPLHLGLTEAGMGQKGIVATTSALSVLLHQGIGDTIRASLTPEVGGDRTKEVKLCQDILQSLDLRSFRPSVTACPGCGRTTSTLFRELAQDIELHLNHKLPEWRSRYPGSETLKIAVMGCVVNGPGESRAADIGISLPGSGESPRVPVFIDGQRNKILSGNHIAEEFITMIDDYVDSRWGNHI